MIPMNDRLFAYGTLRQDVANSKFQRLLGGSARLVARGRTAGRLFDLGSYPGFVLDTSEGTTRWVRGEVYALSDPEETLARLDAYEGCGLDDPEPRPYERRSRAIVLDDGSSVRAWVYCYKLAVDLEKEIPSGDYGRILDRSGPEQ